MHASELEQSGVFDRSPLGKLHYLLADIVLLEIEVSGGIIPYVVDIARHVVHRNGDMGATQEATEEHNNADLDGQHGVGDEDDKDNRPDA